jgi:hypothetical protein
MDDDSDDEESVNEDDWNRGWDSDDEEAEAIDKQMQEIWDLESQARRS